MGELLEPVGDGAGEGPEVVEVTGTNGVDDLPIDALVVVDGNVAKADGLLQPIREFRTEDSAVDKAVKGLSHGVRRRQLQRSDHMGADIDALLDSAREIEGDDVLAVRILGEFIGAPWAALRHAIDTVTEGLELLFDYSPIHACLRSARMRSR